MNINTKEMCKQIKKCRSFLWTLNDGVHYITNRHWLAVFTELPREVLVQLFTKYAQIPQDGQTLNYHFDYGVLEQKAVDFTKILETAGSADGKVTQFIKLYDPSELRIVNFGEYVAYINNDYIKMIDDITTSRPKGSGSMAPVSFNDNALILLPYRLANPEGNELLEELLA